MGKQKCVAKVKSKECFYRKDVGQIAKRFNDIEKKLNSMSYVELNGNGEKTPMQTVLKEIWHATRSQRATKSLREKYEIWMKDTATGRFLRTKGGKIIAWTIWIWVIIGSFNTIGITNIKLTNIVDAILIYFKLK